MKTEQNTRLGILLMALTSLVFSIQDGISRHLGEAYSVEMVVTIRFWFFAAFVTILAARQPGGLRAAVATRQPLVQVFRGALLIAEVCAMVFAFTKLGLVETHAVFSCYPLMVAALSGPVLGEKVGWRRWTAIGIGFIGILIVLKPGMSVFSPYALLPLASALMFALYGLLTRFVARQDSATVSFFWTGVAGAAAITPFGLAKWEPMSAENWGWMLALCITSVTAHFTMIKAYAVAEAGAIQPFAYLQLVFIAALGFFLFGETIRTNVIIGAVVVVGAGIFTLLRARQKERGAA